MVDLATAPYGVLLLRIALGVMFLAHMCIKLFVFKPSGTARYFASLGVPGWMGPLTIVVEAVGGVCLILGILPRYAAIALLPTIIGTIVLVHGPNGWTFTNTGGGWEYPAFWAVALVALALLGDGSAALVPSALLF
ncbi:MAG TPA: DoxX family protein [Alphaproteobacteria bacterium]|jgi:putative oxidoreductase|nr:DoxX family protein [Alphaproteobacteria bacterium]